MNKLNYYSQSGHCFPDLVEKRNGKVVAQMRAIIWKADYEIMNKRFLQTLQEPLKDGIKILFAARIQFDPVRGISLCILDIDPTYTLGDLEQEKQATITRLKAEDLYTRNRQLTLRLLPQRIAIISVESSKGYADFLKIIDENPWGYRFFHLLFPALLQGEQATTAIISQLKRIRNVIQHFDVVAIIRGGGGDVGLSCYNDYKLSKEIAVFPIPVITGIGHATNETVVEMIAFQNAITPTKIAEFLIQKFHNFSVPVQNAQETIAVNAQQLLRDAKSGLLHTSRLFRSVVSRQLVIKHNEIRREATSLMQFARFRFKNEKDTTINLSQSLQQLVSHCMINSTMQLQQSMLQMQQGSRRLFEKCQENSIYQIKNLKNSLTGFQKLKSTELKNLEVNVNNMDPVNVLKRGFTITLNNGRAITSLQEIKKGDVLKTLTVDGAIISNVHSIEKQEDHE